MRKAYVFHHSVERKVVADYRSALRQIVFVTLKKFYVLSLWPVDKNQVKLFLKAERGRVAQKACHAVHQIFVVKILHGLMVAVDVRLYRKHLDVRRREREFCGRVSDPRSNFQNAANLVLLDVI